MTQRPIKFRAWDTHRKVMLSWEHLIAHYEPHEIFQDPEVIPLQFTGLHDENGKEIWEGDIFKNYTGTYVVEYGSWNCGECSSVYGYELGADSENYEGAIEVIGNIYENPELLKEAA